jgi:hypothetical protein
MACENQFDQIDQLIVFSRIRMTLSATATKQLNMIRGLLYQFPRVASQPAN